MLFFFFNFALTEAHFINTHPHFHFINSDSLNENKFIHRDPALMAVSQVCDHENENLRVMNSSVT